MDLLVLIARIGLAAVFVVAALGKLADLEGTRRTLRDFGVPGPLAAAGRVALPAAEVAVAVLLIPATTARWGALAALVLLLAFAAAIGLALARGEEPDCNCFGQLHSSPAGPAALGRNLALGGVAALVAAAGPGNSGGALGDLNGTEALMLAGVLVVLAALAFQAWFSWQLFRQNGRLIARVRALEQASGGQASTGPPPGLPEGVPAPAFELPGLDGAPASLTSLLASGRPLMLVFSDPECAACDPLLAELARRPGQDADELGIAVVTRADTPQDRVRLERAGVETVLLQQDGEVAEAYRAHGVPSAVVVGADGRIATRLAVGQPAIEELLASAATAPLTLELISGGSG